MRECAANLATAVFQAAVLYRQFPWSRQQCVNSLWDVVISSVRKISGGDECVDYASLLSALNVDEPLNGLDLTLPLSGFSYMQRMLVLSSLPPSCAPLHRVVLQRQLKNLCALDQLEETIIQLLNGSGETRAETGTRELAAVFVALAFGSASSPSAVVVVGAQCGFGRAAVRSCFMSLSSLDWIARGAAIMKMHVLVASTPNAIRPPASNSPVETVQTVLVPVHSKRCSSDDQEEVRCCRSWKRASRVALLFDGAIAEAFEKTLLTGATECPWMSLFELVEPDGTTTRYKPLADAAEAGEWVWVKCCELCGISPAIQRE